MKQKITLLALFALAALSITCKPASTDYEEGDIIFQSSESKQANAIEVATHSKFSHVGVLIKKDGKLMVCEAVQPVRFSAISQWISDGKGGKYVLSRLKGSTKLLTPALLQKMEKQAKAYEGKNYDYYFDWSDKELYCSELVWKIYKNAAVVELCPLRKFKDYDFTNPMVKQQLKERFGNKIPMEEDIVSPEDIYKSPMLVTVSVN